MQYVLIEDPWLAGVAGGVFLLLYLISRSRIVLITAAAWLGYTGWEYAIKLQIICDAECNIRIDLLVFYPALFALSIVGLVAFARETRKRRVLTGGRR